MNKKLGFAPILVVLIVVAALAAGVGLLQYTKNRSASISGGDAVLSGSGELCVSLDESACLSNNLCTAHYEHLEAPPGDGEGFINAEMYRRCSPKSAALPTCQKALFTYVRENRETKTKEECIDQKEAILTWKTYRNEQYGFEFQYPANNDFNEKSGLDWLNIAPFISLTVYPGTSILSSKDYPWEIMGKELISLQKNYDGYAEDLSTKNRSQCDGMGDCGQSFFNILKRKVADIPAIDYRQNSVGGADRSVIFERQGIVFQFYHAAWYPLPFDVDKMKEHAGEFIGYQSYQNFEQILFTFKFIK